MKSIPPTPIDSKISSAWLSPSLGVTESTDTESTESTESN